MILDLEAFKENYHQAGKFKDNFQEAYKVAALQFKPKFGF